MKNNDNNQSTELAPQENSGYLALRDFQGENSMAAEMAGLDISFDRIKFPAGGGLVYEFPTENPDNTVPVQKFAAVILHHHPARSYFASAYSGGNAPPECFSMDGITGNGNPGGWCVNCHKNRFKTLPSGARTKECKEKHRLFLLREGDFYPLILVLPTGSLPRFKAYMKYLRDKGFRASSQAITKFSLAKATSQSGSLYSQGVLEVGRTLSDEEWALIRAMSDEVKKVSERMEYTDEPEQAVEIIDPETGEITQPL